MPNSKRVTSRPIWQIHRHWGCLVLLETERRQDRKRARSSEGSVCRRSEAVTTVGEKVGLWLNWGGDPGGWLQVGLGGCWPTEIKGSLPCPGPSHKFLRACRKIGTGGTLTPLCRGQNKTRRAVRTWGGFPFSDDRANCVARIPAVN